MEALICFVVAQTVPLFAGFRIQEVDGVLSMLEQANNISYTLDSHAGHATNGTDKLVVQHSRVVLQTASDLNHTDSNGILSHRLTQWENHSTIGFSTVKVWVDVSPSIASSVSTDPKFRETLLFFLASVRTVDFIDRAEASPAVSLARSAAFWDGRYASDMAAADAKPDAVKQNLVSLRDRTSFLYNVFVAADKLLTMLSDKFIEDAKEAVQDVVVEKAIKWLKDQLAELVAMFFAKCVDYMSSAMGWTDLVSNLIEAVKGACDTFKAQKLLSAGIVSGCPTCVIKSIQDELQDYSLDNFMAVIQDILMKSLEASMPIVATVIETIKNLWDFLAEAFLHIRDVMDLERVFATARTYWRTEPKLSENAAAFQSWFTGVIDDLPIISSYILAMPLTSNYKAFMSTVIARTLTEEELAENYALWEDLKARAQQFVEDYSVKLTSDNAMLEQALEIAQGGEQPTMGGDVHARIQARNIVKRVRKRPSRIQQMSKYHRNKILDHRDKQQKRRRHQPY